MRITAIFLLSVMALVSCAEKPLPKQELADMPVYVPKPPPPTPKPNVSSAPVTRSKPAKKKPSNGDILVGAAAVGVGVYALSKIFGGGNKKQASGCRNCGADGTVESGDPGASVIMFSAHECEVCNGRGWLR